MVSEKSSFDADRAMQGLMDGLIRMTGLKKTLGLSREEWKPGKPLKLLLAGYVGARNTGSDVRVEEMIRQFRHVLPEKHTELSIMTLNKKMTKGYFQGCEQLEFPIVYPQWLYHKTPKHHGVIACEGSMFKSKFANGLTIMMTSALGMANQENKLSVGYGAEAGQMDPHLEKFVARHCKKSLVICRNEASRKTLEKLGIRTRGGTDTAWTFEPAPLARGAEILRAEGWDGKKKVLVVCPINPFWWPVKPSLTKTMGWLFSGKYKDEHHQSIYFHHHSDESVRKYNAYLNAIAEAVNSFSQKHALFTVLVGMEQLDRRSCVDLASRLSARPGMLISDRNNMYDLVSVLRNASLLVSSRFHAVVTSMGGLVPSAGITMDERIRNIMLERGHEDLLMTVDDEHLADKLMFALNRLLKDGEAIGHRIGEILPRQLKLMGEMGMDLVDEISRVYPDFPHKNLTRSWENYLPPLSKTVARILEQYAA
jgi:polysaccharide pyruvyl transferase WcaK-like protein